VIKMEMPHPFWWCSDQQYPRSRDDPSHKTGGFGLLPDLLDCFSGQGLVNPNEGCTFPWSSGRRVANSHICSLSLRSVSSRQRVRNDRMLFANRFALVSASVCARAIYSKKSSACDSSQRESADLECVFDSVYKECIVNSRKQKRLGLFRNLLFS
jgi:hypothetical protein